MPRDYRSEYDNYHSRPEQIKKRNKRNEARRKMMAAGKVKRGDGKDIDHKNGDPTDNSPGNLRVQSKSQNRSFPRNKNAGKKR